MGEQPHSPLGHSRNQPQSEGLGCAPTSSHQPLVEDSSWEVEGVHSNLPRGWQSGSGASPQAKGCGRFGPGYTVRSGTYSVRHTTHSSATCAPTNDPS